MSINDEFEAGDYFHFGGQESEFVEIQVLSRSDADDYGDGNWMVCTVNVVVGCFKGCFQANIRTEELASFAVEVRPLYESLSGSATLATMEEQLRIELIGDGRGHISCDGIARDDAGTGNTLTFRLVGDQTQLYGTMSQLEDLLIRYPVRGSPAA